MSGTIHIENSSHVKESLIEICHETGIFTSDNIENIYYHNLIESGIIDSLGVVCLQDQIETHYGIDISIDQFVAELNTLDKLVNYLASHSALQAAA